MPIKQVGANYHATLDGQLAMEQIEEILQRQKEIGKKESNVDLIWNSTSNLKLQDVKVKNDESEKAILEGIDFTWNGNGAIGVIGESGAGKSTLIDVLAGFLTPSGGKMIVNGVEIDGSTREEWQKNIAYIPQQPYIFPLSLKDNICFYETNTTDEEVERVMNEVGLRSLVTSLPNGMYERIGEGGRMLSGGQEQRVAMARALLSKKPIILLDEPTAHLDIETEFEIKQAMLRLFEGKLVFLATHRLHWMKQMDHILILNKGKMIESGTYEELVKNEALHVHRKERG